MSNEETRGRPPIDWSQHETTLIASFQNGLNITQACLQVNVSRESYYEKIKSDEDFSDKMEKAQQFGLMKARQNITEAVMNGDREISKWYLERRDKEFKPKSDVTSYDKPIPILGGMSVSENNSSPEDSEASKTN